MDPEDFEQESSYKDEVKHIILPEWLTEQFPEHRPHQTISYDEGTFWVNTSHTTTSFPTVIAAYEYAALFKDDLQVVFDASVDGHGGRLSENGFFCEPENGYVRLLMGITTEDIADILKHDYLEWLTQISVEYNNDPDDFVKAHKWLSHHPAFWIKGTKEKSFQWATDVGLDKMSINVWANEETGKPVIFLEHGMHHEDGYTFYYHDDRIFVREETFEKAVIAMAKKVNKVYDLDGYERGSEESETGE